MTHKPLLTLTAFALLGVGALALAVLPSRERDPSPLERTAVARGEYLVKIMGCHDCHTPWSHDARPAPSRT